MDINEMFSTSARVNSEWGYLVASICNDHSLTLPRQAGETETKGELCQRVFGAVKPEQLTFDTALPQGIVDGWQETHNLDIRGECVMVYASGQGSMDILFPLTISMFEKLVIAMDE